MIFPTPTNRIPLARALFCIACESVFSVAARCPCGSDAFIPVANWLRQIPR